MNILILGSSGNIGQVLTNSLKDLKYNVYGISRTSGDIKIDLLNLKDEDISEILERYKINVIINAAGVISTTTLEDYMLNSIILLKFINNKIGKKLKYIVIGSAAEYGVSEDNILSPEVTSPNPHSIYGYSKLSQTAICEYYKRNFNIDILVFRLFNIIAPNLPERSFIGSLIKAIEVGSKGSITINNSKIVRDFLDLRDFNNLVINAINKPVISQAVFNAGSGYNLTYGEVIEEAFKLLENNGLSKPKFIDLNKAEVFSSSICNISDTMEKFDWKPVFKLSSSLDWCLKTRKVYI